MIKEYDLPIVLQDCYSGYSEHRLFNNADIHESLIDDNIDYEKINGTFHFIYRNEIVNHRRTYGQKYKRTYTSPSLDSLLDG